MTTLREAAQQALEALENFAYHGKSAGWPEVLNGLRAALEQPEQEPVAWQWLDTAHFRKKLPVDAEPGAWNPLYNNPPRREWRGLTDEEIEDCWDGYLSDYQLQMIRTIEAKLKERNV